MTKDLWEKLRYELYHDLSYRLENEWHGRTGKISFSAILHHLDEELPASLISEPMCPHCPWTGDRRGRPGHLWMKHGELV